MVAVHGAQTEGLLQPAALVELAEVRVVALPAVPPGPLGPVHRGVGGLHELLGVVQAPAREGHTDAHRRRPHATLDGDVVGERTAQGVGHGLDLLDRGRLVDDHDELVAAHAPDHAGAAHGLHHAIGQHGEEPVAGGVPEGVVDLLEPVDVDVQHGQGAHGAGQPQGVAEQGEDGVAVGQTGEGVRRGTGGELVVVGPVGRDVGDLDDEPAGRAVLVADGADREVAPQVRAVVADEALLDAVGVPVPGEQLLLEREIDGDVVRMGDVGQAQLSQLLAGAVQERDHGRVHVEEAPAQVDQTHRDGRMVEDLTDDGLMARCLQLVRPDHRVVP